MTKIVLARAVKCKREAAARLTNRVRRSYTSSPFLTVRGTTEYEFIKCERSVITPHDRLERRQKLQSDPRCPWRTKSTVWVRLLADRLVVAGPADHPGGRPADREGASPAARRYRCRVERLVAAEHDLSQGLGPGLDLHLGLVLSWLIQAQGRCR